MTTPATTPQAPALPAPVQGKTQTPPATPPAVAETKPAPTETKERESKKFGHLLSRELVLRNKGMEIAQERQKLAADIAAVEEYKKTIAEAKQRPGRLLEANNVTLDELVADVLGEKNPLKDTEQRILSRVEQLEQDRQKRVDEEKRTQGSLEQQRRHQAVEAFRGDVLAAIEKAADKFPHVARLKLAPAVEQKVKEHYESTGKMLAVDEAIELVEKDYSTSFPNSVEAILQDPTLREIVRKKLEAFAPVIKKEAPQPLTVKRRVVTNNLRTTDAPAAAPERPRTKDEVWKQIKAGTYIPD